MHLNGSVAKPMFGTDTAENLDRLEDYKSSARIILCNLGFKFKFVQRHQSDLQPFIEIWNNDEDTRLVNAGLVFLKDRDPALLHLMSCGKTGPSHNHQAWGREIITHLDVYRCLVDEMNVLRERRCVRADNPA